jgi:hypothetical protein
MADNEAFKNSKGIKNPTGRLRCLITDLITNESQYLEKTIKAFLTKNLRRIPNRMAIKAMIKFCRNRGKELLKILLTYSI